MASFVSVLLLLGLAAADIKDLNGIIDKALKEADVQLTKEGAGLVVYPPVVKEDLECAENAVLGLNSLYRTGDCTDNSTGHLQVFSLHFGYRLLGLASGSIKYKGDWMSGMTSFNYNSFHLEFTVKNDTECKVTINEYICEDLSNVIFYSSLKKYNGTDLSNFAKKYIIPGLNSLLEQGKPMVEKHLQEEICGHSYWDMYNVIEAAVSLHHDQVRENHAGHLGEDLQPLD